MLNVTLLTSVAKSALVGAVATKLVDTLISSKINNKIEQNKWLRNTKLELFSKLTEDILSTDISNIETQLREIKKTSAKIILLINDRKLSDKIENYTINPDGSIDVDGNVSIENGRLEKLPLKFNKVSGDFYCSYNKLKTLEHSPLIIGGHFYCMNNPLESLEGLNININRLKCDNKDKLIRKTKLIQIQNL